MTKLIKLLALAALCVLSAGCETTSAVAGASKKGIGALSCSEIYNAFNAYEKDKQSVDATKQFAAAMGVPYTGGSGKGYYETAKSSANIALLAQGCTLL